MTKKELAIARAKCAKFYKYENGQKKIKSVKDFLEYLKVLGYTMIGSEGRSAEELNLFFRGHYISDWSVLPTVLREPKYSSEYEKKMYYEAMTRHPNEFNGLSSISRLAKMQHYHWPTRLLDFSSNPLVALWFSCYTDPDKEKNEENKDGCVLTHEVIRWHVEQDRQVDVLSFDSTRALMLACLSRLSSLDQKLIEKIALLFCAGGERIDNEAIKLMTNDDLPNGIKKLLETLKNNENTNLFLDKLKIKPNLKAIDLLRNEDKVDKTNLDKLANELDNLKRALEKNLKNTNYSNNNISEQICEAIRDLVNNRIDICKTSYALKKLIYEVTTEVQAFEYHNIVPSDLLKSFMVMPQISNDRMRLQAGAFMIFGLEKNDKIFNKIIIEKESKNKILKELDQIGINQATLFGDLSSSAKYVKNKIKLNFKEHAN